MNVTDAKFTGQLGLRSIPLPSCLKATSLDGSFLWEVSHQTALVIMIISDDHYEEMSFYEYSSLTQPVILGYPWLRLHNPSIDWISSAIKFNDCSSWHFPTSTVFPLVTMISKRSLVKPRQPPFHLIALMTVALYCYLALCHQKEGYTHSLVQKLPA